MADRENCTWASTIFERSGSIRVKKKAILTISKGSTILRGLTELRLIDQRCQTGLKSTLYGKASAMPCCQHLSRDFKSQVLSRFFLQVKKVERGLGIRLVLSCTRNAAGVARPFLLDYKTQNNNLERGQGSSWPDYYRVCSGRLTAHSTAKKSQPARHVPTASLM